MHGEILAVNLAHPFTGRPQENIERVTRIAKRIIQHSQGVLIARLFMPQSFHIYYFHYTLKNRIHESVT